MPPGFRLALAIAFYFALGTAAQADLTLTIEDLIADQGKIRLNLALNYANNERDGLSLVPTGSKSYISVPTKNNSDILNQESMADARTRPRIGRCSAAV